MDFSNGMSNPQIIDGLFLMVFVIYRIRFDIKKLGYFSDNRFSVQCLNILREFLKFEKHGNLMSQFRRLTAYLYVPFINFKHRCPAT